MSQFNEDNTVEQLFIDTLTKNGWKYIPAEELPRDLTDVIVEPMVKDALIRLNPEIAEDPSRADEVIYKLRAMTISPDFVIMTSGFSAKSVLRSTA